MEEKLQEHGLQNIVIVHDMRPEMSVQDLEEYCSKSYGVVETCCVCPPHEGHPACGLVVFRYSKYATRMLWKKLHTYNEDKCEFQVSAGNNWSQFIRSIEQGTSLKSSCLINISALSSSSSSSAKQMNILDLNEDCLLMIFDYLTFWEQLKCAQSCKYFRSILESKILAMLQSKKVSKFPDLSLFQIRDVFRLFGGSIEQINVNTKELILLVFAARSYPCLKTMTLYFSKMCPYLIKQLSFRCTQLRELCLYSCDFDDACIEKLQMLGHLESLKINQNSKITGAHLNKLEHLKKLDLRACTVLKRSRLIDTLRSLKNLRSFTILFCGVGDDIISIIIEHAPGIEALTIEVVSPIFDGIKDLKCLKSLRVNCKTSPDIRLTMLRNFPLKQRLNLKEFSFEGRTLPYIREMEGLKKLELNFTVVDDGVMQEISQLENLEELHMNCCRDLTEKGLFEVLINCKKLAVLDMPYSINLSEQILKDMKALLKMLNECGERRKKLSIKITGHELSNEINVRELRREFRAVNVELDCNGLFPNSILS